MTAAAHALRATRAAALPLCLIAPAALLIGLLFLYPIGRLAALSIGLPNPTAAVYVGLFVDADYLDILLRTLRISVLVAVWCVLLGYPIAFVMATCRPALRGALVLCVLLPFWTSLLVRNYAWVYLLQRRGVINDFLLSSGLTSTPLPLMFNEFGVVLGMTNALLPFMVLPIYVALQAQDRALDEAAASLGASPSVGFFTVTLPLSLPGVVAGTLIVLSMALGFYVTPALLGGGKVLVAASHIAREIEETLNWPTAAAASMVLLVVVAVLIGFYQRAVARQRVGSMEGADA